MEDRGIKGRAGVLDTLVPVPPLQLSKGTHHRSEFHRESVGFLKSACPRFWKKKGSFFGLDICISFFLKGLFSSILNSPLLKTRHFVENGSLLSPRKLFPLCESQCFVE